MPTVRDRVDGRLRALRTTDIQLQAGETIIDVALGDSERWMAAPEASDDPRGASPAYHGKPQFAAIEINLTIYIAHLCHLLLVARERIVKQAPAARSVN